MGVKTYQAYTMAEALTAAKRDLGADAVILESRTFKRGGFLGVGRKSIFELTATAADRADLSPAASGDRGRRPPRKAARDAYASSLRAAARRGASTAESGEKDRTRTRRLAQALAETHDRYQRAAGRGPVESMNPTAFPEGNVPAARSGSASPQAGVTPAAAPPAGERAGRAPVAAPGPGRGAEPPPASVARRFILTPADTRPVGVGAGVAGTSRRGSAGPRTRRLPPEPVGLFGEVRAPIPPGTAVAEPCAMEQELVAIKTMVGRVLQGQTRSQRGHEATMPAKLFGMYLELIGQDLSEELADRIINGVRDELTAEAWEDESAVREAVLRHLAEFVPAADPAIPNASPDDRPLTIALIGPTGVGKTTTLAKLAASFKLRQHRKVGMVTCDTYRIAAVDQLRTYANIIGLPLEIALTPAEMKQAVHSLRDHEVILIDTAGRGPNDSGRLDELLQCLTAADPHEVHLVLSSTASERVLLREAEAFAVLGVDRIVLTKLDEAVSFGVLINVMQKVGKQLSFITTGQEVPDHIEAGEPRRLAELVLGAEVHA
ncbi:MAG: flagellar biosynthesis protein FlhF [Planctomycetota bacterium]|jgi:flagellar biosynthesis protein FlhF